MDTQCKLSIIVPVYNEEQTLAEVVCRLVADLEGLGLDFEVVISENGSTDSTPDIAEDLARMDRRIRVIHLDQPNYGQAMRQGFISSSGDYLANFSIDFVDIKFLREAISRLGDSDVVLGSKYVALGQDQRPLARRLGGRMLSAVPRALFGLPVSDTHGLLVLRRSKVAPLIKACRFGHEIFDTELIVRAHRAGLAIRELPLRVQEARPSRLGSVKRALRMLVQFGKLRLVLWQEGAHRA